MKNEKKKSGSKLSYQTSEILERLYWAVINHATAEVLDDPQVSDALRQARTAMGSNAKKKLTNRTSLERSYEIEVTQIDYFSKTFLVNAQSEAAAKEKVSQMVCDEPLDTQKDTYDVTETELKIRPRTIEVYTVESLFDIDKEECSEEVLLLSDLTDEQKEYLGLQQKGA